MTEPANKETIHAAVDEATCIEMEKRNKWDLKRVEPTSDPILKVKCVFDGDDAQFPSINKDK